MAVQVAMVRTRVSLQLPRSGGHWHMAIMFESERHIVCASDGVLTSVAAPLVTGAWGAHGNPRGFFSALRSGLRPPGRPF